MKIISNSEQNQLSQEEEKYIINSSWAIYNLENDKLTYHTNSYDYKHAYKNWTQTLKDPLLEYDSNILLINDGDQIFYNSYKLPSIATIVDPNAYLFTQTDFKKYLNTTEFLNTVDSLGHIRKLTLIDSTFNDAIEDGCFNTTYSLIFVNVKQEQDISNFNLEKYFLLLEDYGFLCIQLNNKYNNNNVKSTLEHYFTNLSEKFKTTSISESHSFLVYRKMSNLI